MDEVAFVESLFAPEMRSAVAASPSSLFPSPALPACGRVKALLAVPTPPGSGSGCVVPAPPNSLLGGGIALSQQLTLQPPAADDAPLFVRLHEDDVLSQMLSDQDFPDLPKDAAPKPPANALLLEPLDLPRSAAETLKDAFYGVAEAPPMHFQAFRAPARCAAASVNVNVNFGPLDAGMMPVFPVSGPAYFGHGYTAAGYPPLSPAWLQDQGPEASTPSGNSFQRVHSMKPMGLSPMMGQHQPSPGAVDMYTPQHPVSPGLWISSVRNAQQEAAEDRKPAALLDAIKTSVERPPFSLTISPPASLTSKALKELIVSADFATPPLVSRPKRPRAMKSEPGVEPRAKAARTTSASPVSQENRSGNVAGKAKRCEFPGCTRGQQRKGRCYVHGGIRKCQYGACEKKDRGNGFCISHGGGKRCEYPDCSRAVRRGLLCQIHEAAQKEAGEGVEL
ncbi:WRKY transcription factor 19 [Phytophthora cinnamomi]|uniref:WRKY transcription factor 19 n=1 Tax=Phytophthora cinnamomi TaxID=4785 RepID=UPI00355A75E0|nr:WRKY transcription factor 19 [Phytophthora cinnamomi]